jgi:hypothetical protein
LDILTGKQTETKEKLHMDNIQNGDVFEVVTTVRYKVKESRNVNGCINVRVVQLDESGKEIKGTSEWIPGWNRRDWGGNTTCTKL